MAKINPKKIEGSWNDGYALDRHTVKSVYLGDDEYGHPRFDTTRSEIGELLYKLKYGNDQTVVKEIAETAAAFIQKWKPSIEILIPVTPSKVRAQQPVFSVGAEIAKLLKVPFRSDIVTRRVALPELKNVDRAERIKLLREAHDIRNEEIRGKNVLLFDDLYQTGSTINAISSALIAAGAKNVVALTLTRSQP